MKIKHLSEEAIDRLKTTSALSGKLISKDVKVDYMTAKHIGFTCPDKRYNTSHSVIYFSEKEFPNSWNCDCKRSTLGQGYCKHILAVFTRLNEDSSFLKKFEKEKLN